MKKYAAITFDDGPEINITPAMLDILEKYGVPGSFFLIGENITEETIPIVKRAIDMGFEIENHSFSHYHMDTLNEDEIREEIEKDEELIMSLTGKHTKFFRPPFFDVSDLMYETIDRCFIGGVHCEDWNMEVDAEERARRIVENACDGAIILLHDLEDNTPSVKALDMMIPPLKEKGFEFVTVEELFKIKGVDPAAKESRGKIYDVVA